MKILIIVLVSLSLFSCAAKPVMNYYYYEGQIQGTYFHITYQWSEDLAAQTDSLLNNFNMSLSNYDPNSVISKINKNESAETDELFRKMFERSFEVYQNSDGAFDISVAPIVNAWGFGWIKHNGNEIPDSAEINDLLPFVGMDKFQILENKIVKKFPESMLISNAIAQGLSVDYIADYFKKLGLKNFLIEIGGEIYCTGVNREGKPWRIGVDKPVDGSGLADRENQIVINLSGKAIATSGNYRKFIENNNKKYGHSLNPKTGFPAENSLVSVSVVSDNCMDCDAYATAFMVCGLEKSLEILKSNPKLDAYFIYIDSDGKLSSKMTAGFEKLIAK